MIPPAEFACPVEIFERHEVLEMVRHLDPCGETALAHDLVEEFTDIEISIHVVDAGDAEGGGVIEPSLDDAAVISAFLGARRWIRFPTGLQPKTVPVAALLELIYRPDCFSFPKFARRKTILTHHDFIADGHWSAMQYACRLKRCRVRP